MLQQGELITAIELPAPAPRSAYLKVRERESYEYAIVSAAAVLEMDGQTIRRAALALGSVALRPWRLSAAEEQLAGAEIGDREALNTAIEQSFAQARPLSQNAYKIELAKTAALRAIERAARMSS